MIYDIAGGFIRLFVIVWLCGSLAAATALAHLLYAFILFPDRFLEPLNIPESGSTTPDLLNECRYELEWLLKMPGGLEKAINSG
mgnify:CR=1 FL=1